MDANGQYPFNSEPASNHEAPDTISIEQLRHLVQLLDRSDVSEVEVKRAEHGTRLVLRKARAAEQSDLGGYQLAATGRATDAPPAASQSVESQHFVVAPLVGIFRTSAKPRGKTLVSVGDRVKVGQLVGSIQSLNVINEVETSIAGRVTEILVQDGQPVEYGQQIMTIDSSEEA
ncbi:MAG TPA: biotin/lipoyl-containing protein [Ktedonosporobacter sp.]|nr:biotin/lipoyl-containing protein [Ktedonosporobacter sp.]